MQVAVFADSSALKTLFSPVQSGAIAPAVVLYDALVDTGASATCISPKVVAEIGLNPIGKCQMISASHVVDVNQFTFAIGLPLGMSMQPNGMVSGNFNLFENLTGLEFSAGGSAFDILIGMDIIRRGSLKLDFDGHFSFCF